MSFDLPARVRDLAASPTRDRNLSVRGPPWECRSEAHHLRTDPCSPPRCCTLAAATATRLPICVADPIPVAATAPAKARLAACTSRRDVAAHARYRRRQ